VNGGRRPRLTKETFANSGHSSHLRGEHFDGDFPVQVRVFRNEDNTHAAPAELTYDAIMSQPPQFARRARRRQELVAFSYDFIEIADGYRVI
jgi:hypothetical protein